ncbi:MAG: prolipoprotein diacylglyceryl transferase [Ruminococcaceae bacterium]|nr:prolipoprotein diacylglyceryl transferase [Oscillospiraceae bacterium]
MPLLSTASHWIAFPSLDWQFNISEGFSLFGLQIKWYGVLIAIGFLLAVIYGIRRAGHFGVNPDKMIDAVLVCTLMGFVGARLYFILFSPDLQMYLDNPITILQVWKGGLGIYGGIIAAFLTGILMCKLCKLSFFAMADLASLGFLIGQAVGRWGNFFNQEAFGSNTTLPWGMTGDIIQEGTHAHEYYDVMQPVHPTFLYESLWCILGFVLLHILSKRLYKFKGQIFCGYLVWYGAGRFFIEGLRTDSLMAGTMRTSQLVAVLAILLGVILPFILWRRQNALPKELVLEQGDEVPDLKKSIISGLDHEEETTTTESVQEDESEPVEAGQEDKKEE